MAKRSKGSTGRVKKVSSSRPKPLVPRSGFRVDGSRYGCGGKITK